MIHINELLDSTLFGNFKIIAGYSGINNSMTNIVILEYESFINSYEVFNAGDFVLSSLFFAKDNPHLIEEALLNLIKRLKVYICKKVNTIILLFTFLQK